MSFAERLRLIAFHEAGHAVVAEQLTGLDARVDIWKGRDGTLQGWCQAGGVLSPEALMLFAVAGSCAETLADPAWQRRSGDAVHKKLISSMSAQDVACIGPQRHMSASDFLGSVLGAHFFDRGLNLCQQLWLAIDARARLEISAFHQREAAGVAALV